MAMGPWEGISFAHHFHTKMPSQQGAHETYSDFDLRNNFRDIFPFVESGMIPVLHI